ncbi:extracellular matrix regulator RemB [Cytobacillus sp. FJAT-54145]|uniref:Extracellular matrix regulator RemB n=1 Tax=Cytobacillus spartinae TaxID=3299023 RepID=A0ABW6KII3_9BACI
MYVHVGEDILVRTRDIIAIIDKESVNSSQYIKEFLDQHDNQVITLSKGAFKSIVITIDKIYYSPLASGTLKKRSAKLAVQEY